MTSKEILRTINLLEVCMKEGDTGDVINLLMNSTDTDKCDVIDTINWLKEDVEEHTSLISEINVCAHEPYCSFEEARKGFSFLYSEFFINKRDDGWYLVTKCRNAPLDHAYIGMIEEEAIGEWKENSYWHLLTY